VTASRNVGVYVVGTGEITGTLAGPDSFIAQNTPAGCAVIDCAPGIAEHLYRVDETDPPSIISRIPLGIEITAAVDLGAVLSLDVPAGVVAKVEGHEVGEADETGLEIEFASPGVFTVEVGSFPYVPVRQRVVVD